MTHEELLAIVTIVITLFLNTIGGILWLSQKRKIAIAEEKVKISQERLKSSEEARKEVNKERDYAHLKNNQQQMLQMLPLLLDDMREI